MAACLSQDASQNGYTMRYVAHDVWDSHLGQFEDVSFEQTAAFAARRWGADRTRCVIFEYRGKVVGGASFIVFGIPMLKRGVAYLKHGPVWRHRRDVQCMETYRNIVTLLQATLAQEEGLALVLIPRPHPQVMDFERTELHALGFVKSGENLDPNRYFVDLSLDQQSQLKNLEQKWRYNLKRAQKNDLEVHQVDACNAIGIFETLHSGMASRKKFHSTDPISAISEMTSSLSARLRPVMFLASSNGQPVAGAVAMICGDVAYYIFGASNDAALPLRAGYALQWRILEFVKDQGAKWYDLGGEAGTTGLRQFKKGLAGKNGVVLEMPGELHYCADLGAAATRKLVVTARDALRRMRNVRMKT